MKFLFLLLLGIMELREFLSKIQLPLFVTNAKVWLFSATIILGAKTNNKTNKQVHLSSTNLKEDLTGLKLHVQLHVP